MVSFEIIKIKDLNSFVESDRFRSFKTIPITTHRAISQSLNPRANAEDVALLIAIDADEVIGYFGLLPEYMNNEKVYWNSCWWAHPVKGKIISMQLFYKAMELCNQRMILTDFTAHTKPLIERTSLFNLEKEKKGLRIFLRFYFADLLPVQKKFLRILKPFLKVADIIMNFFIDARILINQNKTIAEYSNWLEINEVDDEIEKFISSQNTKESFKRNKNELNWIINNNWVKNNVHDTLYEKSKYYFSSFDVKFGYYLYKFVANNRIEAFVMFQERNKHFSIPYLYYEPQKKGVVIDFIISYLLKSKALSFYTYNPELISVFANEKSLFIKRIQLTNHFAFSKSLSFIHSNEVVLQDGDGDVVFT